jgi:hypothetical protein
VPTSSADIKDDTIDSADYAGGSIDAEHLAADIVDETKIADDGIDSEHYNDGSIDAVHLAADIIDETKIADDGIDSEHYNDGSIDEDHLAAALAFDDGDLLNLGGITMSGTNDEGLVLPAWANVTPTTDQAYLTYDSSANALKVYEGGWVTIGATAAPIDALYVTLQVDGTLSAERVLTESTQGIDFTDGGANSTLTVSIDTTEVDATTWSDAANASNTWTFDVSGTNTTMIAGSAMMSFSHDVTVTGNDIVFGNAETLSNATNGSIIATDGTNEIAIFKTVGSAAAEITISPATTGNNPVISATGENDAGIVFQNAEGEEYLLLDSVGTDKNYLKVLSSATGTGLDNQVSLAAVGDDTNIGMIIDTKGTGTLTLGTADTNFVVTSDAFTVGEAGAVSGVTTLAMTSTLTGATGATLGSATTDATNDLIMIMGNRADDPTTTMAMSDDVNGDFSIVLTNGDDADITLTATDDIYLDFRR